MITNVQELENVISVFCSLETDENERISAHELIQNWSSSPDSINLSLEALSTSFNQLLSFFAASAIMKHLMNNYSAFSDEIINNVFMICFERLHSVLNKQNTPSENGIIRVMAYIALKNNSYFSKVNELTPNELLIFFDFVFDFYEKSSCVEMEQEKINELIPVVIMVLKNSTVNQTWFSLHKFAIMNSENLTAFEELFPLIQTSLRNVNLVPGALELYEAILQIEPINFKEEQISYIIKMISLMILYATFLMNRNNFNNVQFASFIWSTTLEYDIDFFAQPFVEKFSYDILTRFLKEIHKFLINPNEFFAILESAKTLFGMMPQKNSKLSHFPIYLLNILISIIDYNLSYCNKKMEEIIFSLTSYNPGIFIPFIENKINNKPTLGFFYAFSFFPKKIRKSYARTLFKLIPDNCTIFFTFVKKCAKLLPEDSIEIINRTYQMMPNSYLEGAETMVELIQCYPKCFIDNFNSFILPLIFGLNSLPFQVCKYILAGLFSILPSITFDNNQQLEEILQGIGFNFVRCINQITNIDQDFTNVYLDFLKTVIDGTSDFNLSQPFQLFFQYLFDKIAETINFWNNPSDQNQYFLNSIVEEALLKKWISNKSQILQWIYNVLPNNPVPSHFRILSYLIELLPTQEINSFVLLIHSFTDPQLIIEVIKFLKKLFEAKACIFFDNYDISFILSLLDFHNNMIIESSLDLILTITESAEFSHPYIESIMDKLVSIVFIFPVESIKIFKVIAFKHFEPNSVFEFLVCNLQFSENKEFNRFKLLFMDPNSEQCSFNQSIENMIISQRK